jgi:pimeloyl-ACP methyl ester carboxylesterase
MRLHVAEAGDGPRTAILVHGLTSDHGGWCRVAPALVERGYRVLMPDLRGHGVSPRGDYTPQHWAGDLVESLPAGADLAIGHSLGGMSLALAVERLRPELAVYVDPAWKLTAEQHQRWAADFRAQLGWDESQLRKARPRWSEKDIAARMVSVSRFDPRCIEGLLPGEGQDHMPSAPATKSLVMLADPSELVPPGDADLLRRAGFDVVSVPGSGHSIFRDDLDGFLAALDAWLRD